MLDILHLSSGQKIMALSLQCPPVKAFTWKKLLVGVLLAFPWSAVVALGLTFLCGCRGPLPDNLPPADFTTAHGVQVYANGIPFEKAAFDLMDDWYVRWLPQQNPGRYTSVQWCMRQAYVRLEPIAIPCTWYDNSGVRHAGDCAGMAEGAFLRVVKTVDGNPYGSAYIHEMTHWQQNCHDSPIAPDYYHLEETANGCTITDSTTGKLRTCRLWDFLYGWSPVP